MTTRIQRQLRERARRGVAPPPASPGRSFGRDVLVNVLANLIAAGVVYVAAVAAGYITADRMEIAAVVVMLLFSGGQVFVSTNVLDRHGNPPPAWSKWLMGGINALFFAVFLILLVQALR
ncbi:hypothetical protein [Micromonospora chalcea]|uniref:hypothetical protein n=1 Tax=Micromonospora chalcea TaxID=1874 RepID=UPI003822A1CC